MPTLSGCCKKIIKNLNLCISIILILSFLLVSYLQRRIKCVFKNFGYSGGGRRATPVWHRKAPGGPSPHLPRAGGNQSWLTADIGFGNMIPVRSKRSTTAIRVRWLGWRVEGGVGGVWRGAWVTCIYTRHIRNTKGQRSL